MTAKVRILVVEDEMIIAAKIAMFLEELGYEVAAILPRAEDALAHVETTPPDLALVDVQLLGEMDGVELATVLRASHQLPVIFLTANTDDATFERAKTAQPYAFLQKPFRKTELRRALALALQRMENGAETPAEPTAETPDSPGDESYILHDRIFVRYQDKMVKLMFDDILHIAADRSYCRIVTTGKEYLLSVPMKRLEDKLPVSVFQRIHRSHIINMLRVEEVSDGIVRVAGESLPLSPALKGEFMKRLNAV